MIKLHTSTDNQFYFTVCGRNGRVILTSETYVKRWQRNHEMKKINNLFHTPLKVVDKDEK